MSSICSWLARKILTSQRLKQPSARVRARYSNFKMQQAGAFITTHSHVHIILWLKKERDIVMLYSLQRWSSAPGCAKYVWGTEAETWNNGGWQAKPVPEDDCRDWWPQQNQDQPWRAAHWAYPVKFSYFSCSSCQPLWGKERRTVFKFIFLFANVWLLLALLNWSFQQERFSDVDSDIGKWGLRSRKKERGFCECWIVNKEQVWMRDFNKDESRKSNTESPTPVLQRQDWIE